MSSPIDPTSESIILPHFIAITGQEGSGKDTYAKHLAEKGYLHISAGDFIRDVARSKGYSDPLPRNILSQVGDELKQQFGLSPITEASLARYEKSRIDFPTGLVISGFRRVGELEAFKARCAVVLWISATEKIRYRNLGYRNDRPDWQTFLIISNREYFGKTDGGKKGVNLQAVEALASCKVVNDGSLDDLYQKADQALAQFATT